MPSPRDRGSVLIADLVLASAVVVLVAAATAAAGRVSVYQQEQREAARVAAVTAARTGDVPAAVAAAGRLAPGRSVALSAGGGRVVARLTGSVRLAHPEGAASLTITETVVVPIAPYRSNRG
ncbi:MAG: hypothetical protein QY307_05895 [Acidimicrobiia bacterium]|nr:MAG: hypothetical protein QY307_05895 [Acidimicrobiia bacterium]